MQWSDGRERSGEFEGSELYRSIRSYFEVPLDEEILRLRWDNEYMRKLLEQPAVKATAAGR